MNWIHHHTYNWLKWLDDEVTEGTIPIKLSVSSGAFTTATGGVLNTGEIECNLVWKRIHNTINVKFSRGDASSGNFIGGFLSANNANILVKLQSGTWPDAFIKTEHDRMPITLQIDGIPANGMLQIVPLSSGATNDWLIEQDLQTYVNDFGTVNNQNNGIHKQSITFQVDPL